MLDVCARRNLIAEDVHRRGKQLLERIVSMLVKMTRGVEPGTGTRKGTGTGTGTGTTVLMNNPG